MRKMISQCGIKEGLCNYTQIIMLYLNAKSKNAIFFSMDEKGIKDIK